MVTTKNPRQNAEGATSSDTSVKTEKVVTEIIKIWLVYLFFQYKVFRFEINLKEESFLQSLILFYFQNQ